MAHGAAAVGRTSEGQVIFVDDALPGERVRASVFQRKKNFLHGRAEAILEPSPGRVEPPCPYVPECGGCQWQHATYETQLAMKVEVLRSTLRRAGAIAPEPEVIACDAPLRYRIRGEFHIVPPGAMPGHRLGFNRRRSWSVIPVDDCLIHHPHITEALAGIAQALDRAGAGTMRSIHLTTSPDRRELLWQARGGQAAPSLQYHLTTALPDHLVHQDSLTLEYDGARLDGRPGAMMFRVDADTFVQVNHAQAHRLYGCALTHLGDRPGRMLEGYAGFGAISIFAGTRPDEAARPASMVLIEESRASALMGRLHLRMHDLEGRATFVHGRLEERLSEYEEGVFDTAVIDPPRAGCSPEVIAELARLRPARLVYVSCDPATLARDLVRLAANGYEATAQTLVDMFPQTYHLESVTRLDRVPGP